jgi:hypothetical protein
MEIPLGVNSRAIFGLQTQIGFADCPTSRNTVVAQIAILPAINDGSGLIAKCGLGRSLAEINRFLLMTTTAFPNAKKG